MSDNPHNLPWTWDKSRFTICDSRGMRIFDAPKIHLVENLELVIESVNSHALLQQENLRLREGVEKIIEFFRYIEHEPLWQGDNLSMNEMKIKSVYKHAKELLESRNELHQAKQALKEGE